MHSRIPGMVVLLALPAAAFAQTGYSITGGMSNFDCSNHCDDPCDEFEVEIEDCRPEDVIHTWRNGNYGSPTVTLSADGLYTIVDYRNPLHPTPVGVTEHFGITLRQLSPYNMIRARWMRNGQPATVNGQVPVQGGGTAPATQPMLPSISAEMTFGSGEGDGVALSVTNNDPVQGIWVKRSAQVTQGVVALESLVRTNTVVTNAVPIDASPVYLGPGGTLTSTSDLVEVEDNESVVFVAQYFQDLTQAGLFTGGTHTPGPELGNVMTASIASPGGACETSSPVIQVQPQTVNAAAGHEVALQVDADGNDMPLSYQWLKEGVELTSGGKYSGVTSDELSIESLDASTEGFYSVRVSNTCGVTVSDSALVFITGHNIEPPHPPVCLSITGQPRPASSYAYSFAEFAMSADGPGGLNYQWQVADANAPGGWADITDGEFSSGGDVVFVGFGATEPLLAVVAMEADPLGGGNATGNFRCVASNSCGTVTSNAATLTVFLPVASDSDADGDVDETDLEVFAACATGPSIPYDPNNLPPGCILAPDAQGLISADRDGDGDVDLADFSVLQRCYSGAGNPADPNCGN